MAMLRVHVSAVTSLAVVTPRPSWERVDGAQRQTGEGLLSHIVNAAVSLTPHPPLRGTFSLKGRRKEEAEALYGTA
jgi:hypothetical protein